MSTSDISGIMRALGGRGSRGGRCRRPIPRQRPRHLMLGRPRGAILSRNTESNEAEATSDEELQRHSGYWDLPCNIPIIPPLTTLADDANAATVPILVPGPQKKRGRGPAQCTEFDKLRKHGKVPLKINDGEMAPCCENAQMFTTRISWIVKHHCNMGHARWTDVPKSDKDELIERVLEDFELDWDLYNHRMAVWKQLRKRFNAVHYELHKKYLTFGSHEEALTGGSSMVDPIVWETLCGRWGSESFKKISEKNRENRKLLNINHTSGQKSFVRRLEEMRDDDVDLVDFFKLTRYSEKKGKFVTDAAENLHKEMIGKRDLLEPEQRTVDVAAGIFREVLGSKPGYARGLGEMVIPEATRETERKRDKEYTATLDRHKKEVEFYKQKVEEMAANHILMMERQLTTNEALEYLLERDRQYNREPLGETSQGANWFT